MKSNNPSSELRKHLAQALVMEISKSVRKKLLKKLSKRYKNNVQHTLNVRYFKLNFFCRSTILKGHVRENGGPKLKFSAKQLFLNAFTPYLVISHRL